MTSIPQPERNPGQATIPTWKLTALMIRNQWGVYTLHFLFSLLIFAEQLAPGLIVKAIFDRLSGQGGAQSATSDLFMGPDRPVPGHRAGAPVRGHRL